MTRLSGVFAAALALLGLLAMLACAGEEKESTPTPQATGASTRAGEQSLSTATAQATTPPTGAGGGAVEMGIDPETTGNSGSTLGTLESCVRVDVPSPAFDDVSDYNIDVYVKGDTQAPIGYDAAVTYDQNLVHIAAPGTDTLVKMPGALEPTGESLPERDGTFITGAIYLEPTQFGTPGDGTLVRLGLDIGGSGLVTFTLGPPPSSAYASDAGIHTLALVSAQLAVNQDCPQ